MHKNELPGDKADWADRPLRDKFLVIGQRQMWNETVRSFEALAQHFSAGFPAQFTNRSVIGEKHERMLGQGPLVAGQPGKLPNDERVTSNSDIAMRRPDRAAAKMIPKSNSPWYIRIPHAP
ncbi:hypothetical protein X739_09220 [Mesorhizobium sp. LNHC220B00]|nr:hypothetical protein X739_09220 [Mesorhizobium sp. LNHC220B00]ESY99025.1 hypothetical protein X738_13270 [Mesorhizobium sp. LNHC209A00]